MKVRRTGRVAAPVEDVWALVADPHSFPRWWPRTARVEDVRGAGWTSVLVSDRGGKQLRADWTVIETRAPERRAWEQELEDTPFARILARHVQAATLRAADGAATEVQLEVDQTLRGWARLAPFMMRRAMKAQLDEALDGLRVAAER